MTDDQAAEAAEPDPTTYSQVGRRYGARVWEAIERRNELDGRYHLGRARDALKARGEYDPAKHGTGNDEPLTTAEHLERIALDEHIARHYEPHYELNEALKAGATLAQVAYALGCREDEARERVRSWADGQRQLSRDYEGKFGLSDAEHAAVLARTADPETYPDGVGDPANIGIRADREAGREHGRGQQIASGKFPEALMGDEGGKARAADLADVGYGLDPDLSYPDAVRLKNSVNREPGQREAGA